MDSPLPTSLRVLAQAAGMVSVQAECSVQDAAVLIEQRAHSMGWTVDRVARGVVEKLLRFAPLDP